jgi:hypothetical protein
VILTVQATEVTASASNRQTGGTGMEVVERFLFYGIDGKGTGLGVNLAVKLTIMVSAATTAAGTPFCNMAVMGTQLAFHGLIGQWSII